MAKISPFFPRGPGIEDICSFSQTIDVKNVINDLDYFEVIQECNSGGAYWRYFWIKNGKKYRDLRGWIFPEFGEFFSLNDLQVVSSSGKFYEVISFDEYHKSFRLIK